MTSPSSPILSCQNVSIRYMVGDFKNIGLKEWLMRRLTGNYKVIDFWADVNGCCNRYEAFLSGGFSI